MKKSTYKNCNAGHFYPASLDKCPFCKSENIGSGNEGSNEEKTLMMGNQGNNDDKTLITGDDNQKTTPLINVQNSGGGDDDRTVVVTGKPLSGEQQETYRATRKLVGWLVSYTLHELGVDFRLYEGQNVIGRDPKANIRIVEDTAMSSTHATMLYRGNSLYFRDEMSTNPSFINGEEVLPGNTIKLNDGDKILVGNTLFTLRMAIL